MYTHMRVCVLYTIYMCTHMCVCIYIYIKTLVCVYIDMYTRIRVKSGTESGSECGQVRNRVRATGACVYVYMTGTVLANLGPYSIEYE